MTRFSRRHRMRDVTQCDGSDGVGNFGLGKGSERMQPLLEAGKGPIVGRGSRQASRSADRDGRACG
jgi:hypothetical protein